MRADRGLRFFRSLSHLYFAFSIKVYRCMLDGVMKTLLMMRRTHESLCGRHKEEPNRKNKKCKWTETIRPLLLYFRRISAFTFLFVCFVSAEAFDIKSVAI